MDTLALEDMLNRGMSLSLESDKDKTAFILKNIRRTFFPGLDLAKTGFPEDNDEILKIEKEWDRDFNKNTIKRD